MRNLHKFLAMALSLALMSSLAVTGVNASFTDSESIDHDGAVNTLTTLGVISGYEDGSFQPDGVVKRSEMAKMIAVILNGGKEPVLDTSSSSFSDTKDHWAKGYIEYCAAQGILNGYEDGTFRPEQTVTATEAAKMLLTAMGYHSDVFGFVGDRWALNVAVEANKAGLYEELLSVNPSAGLDRDSTAQMIFNALFAGTMEVSYQLDPATGKYTTTYVLDETNSLFDSKFHGDDSVSGILTGMSYNATKDTFTYTLDENQSFTCKGDYTDLYGMNVTVLQNTKPGEMEYGLFVKDGSILAESFATEVDISEIASSKRIEVAGKTYKTSGNRIEIRAYNGDEVAFNGNSLAAIKLIDTTGDGAANLMVVLPMTLDEVTYVGSDSYTFKNSGNLKKDTILTSEALSKGDKVLCVDAANTVEGKDTYTVVSPKTAVVESYKSAGGNQFRIDGQWMTLHSTVANALSSKDVGVTVEYVAFGSVLYAVEITSDAEGVEDIALVYDYDDKTTTGGSTTYTASLIFADGSKKTVSVVDEDGGAVSASGVNGKLVSFEILNGGYVLTAIDESNAAGFQNADNTGITLVDRSNATSGNIKSVKDANGKTGTYEIADDAIVFFYNSTDKTAKLYSGKELKSLPASTYTSTVTAYATERVNGFETVTALAVSHTAFPGTLLVGNQVGYLTADAYKTYEDGKWYVNYEMWTAEGAVTCREEGSVLTDRVAGNAVVFDSVADGVVKNLRIVDLDLGTVTGWDGSKRIQIAGSTDCSTYITAETQILYVDSSKKTGVSGGSIMMGADITGDGVADVNNVRYLYNSSKDMLEAIIVDVNNEMEAAESTKVSSSASAADVTNALKKVDTVTVGHDLSSGSVTVESGKTLILTAAQTSGVSVTIENGGTLVAPNGEIVGKNSLTSAGDITVSSGGANLTVTANADVVVNGDMVMGTNDTLNLSTYALKGVEGVTITIRNHSNTTCADNFFETMETTNAGELTGSADTTGTYTYRTWSYTDTNADAVKTVSGWVKVQ